MLETKINGSGKKVENIYILKPTPNVLKENAQPSHNPRTFYATPYGEIHLKMPSVEYIENEERMRWNWYTIKINPSYER